MSRFRPMEGLLLHVVAAVLTVFPGRAPANPMKVHNVLFVTFGAYALHLRLVAVDHHLEFVVGVLYWLFMLPGRVSFIRWHIPKPR